MAFPVPSTRGIQHLSQQEVDLPPGVWTDTPLEVNLTLPGEYLLDADVRGSLTGTSPINAWILARLWNVTTGAPVANSDRLVYQNIDDDSNGGVAGNGTAPISELIRVNAPTTIRVQARRTDTLGSATTAQIRSDVQGRTSLRYVWLGP